MPKPEADRKRGGGPQSAPRARGAEPHRGSLARRAALFVAGLSWVRNVALSMPVVRNAARRIGAGEELDAGLAALRAHPDLQASLVRDGYMVRCYVPYGGQSYEYVLGCVRRLPGGALQRLRERTGRRRRRPAVRP